MSILDKQFAAESNNYISLANIIILISDLTDTPISDAKTYLLNARIDEALDVFKIDERMNFYRINLDETPLEDHEDYMVNFRKADLASFAPIAKHNIFNAVSNDYFDNKTWTNDPVEDEFLTIDQTIEYIRSVTGITYHNKLLGSISERGQITPYFYDDSYIAKRIGNLYCEKIKGYFYFKNLGGFLARNDTRAFIGNNPILDVIYVRSLLFQSANEFKPGDAVNLYNFKPVDFESAMDALVTSVQRVNFRFLRSNIDNYLKHIDDLRSYIPDTVTQNSLMDNNNLDKNVVKKTYDSTVRLLNVLLYKSNYDISAYSGTTNTNIVFLSEQLGTPITKHPVSQWIIRVKQLREKIKLEQCNLELISNDKLNEIDKINHKTRAAVTRILNVLLYKANYDITARPDDVNIEIVDLSNQKGAPIDEHFVNCWLEKVRQLRVDVDQSKRSTKLLKK